MADEKDPKFISDDAVKISEKSRDSDSDNIDYQAREKLSTLADEKDMQRLGRKQELRRNFSFWQVFSFSILLMSSWESVLQVSAFGLNNGGTGGIIWLFIASFICILCVIASIAEMASMAPTAGGQYHWTSEFAPPSVQKPLSYVIGWLSSLGWVTGIPAGAQILTQLISGLIWLHNPDANIGALWQQTLIMYAWILFIVLFITYGFKLLPMMEIATLFIHLAGFVVFIGVLWSTKDRAPAHQVFFTFHNGGWSNIGTSVLVGLTVDLWCFIGPDSSAHMGEETRDSSRDVPRAMMWSTTLNGFMAIITLITFCFCIGDTNAVLNSQTGIPVVQVVYNVTGSLAATAVLTTILIITGILSGMNTAAATSRTYWSFARDNGLPFSKFFSKVNPERELPINALFLTLAISLILASMNFGSNVALQAILSVSNAALVATYISSIACVRLRRIRGQTLPARRWSLGKWGGPINDVALAFLVIGFVFSFFPEAPKPSAPDMNWACLIFGVVILGSGLDYALRGRKHYVGPVTLVKHE